MLEPSVCQHHRILELVGEDDRILSLRVLELARILPDLRPLDRGRRPKVGEIAAQAAFCVSICTLVLVKQVVK